MADRGRRSDGIRVGRVHVTGRVGESLPTAEQRAHDRLWLDRTLRSERASEQNADRSIGIDLACYRHGVLLQERRGTPVPVAGEQSSPLGIPSHRTARRGFGTRVAAHKNKKAPDPCELRALLRDAPSSPCTRHGRRRITGHRRTLRSDDASYARPLDRARNLTSLAQRDRNRFRSLEGRVTTATPVPGNWTSCMAG